MVLPAKSRRFDGSILILGEKGSKPKSNMREKGNVISKRKEIRVFVKEQRNQQTRRRYFPHYIK